MGSTLAARPLPLAVGSRSYGPAVNFMAAATPLGSLLVGGWLCGGEREPVSAQGFLDAAGVGGFEALLDRLGLLEVGPGVGGVGVLEMAVADSFQCVCFLLGGTDVAGDGQRLAVVLAGLLAGRGPGG